MGKFISCQSRPKKYYVKRVANKPEKTLITNSALVFPTKSAQKVFSIDKRIRITKLSKEQSSTNFTIDNNFCLQITFDRLSFLEIVLKCPPIDK